MIARVLAVRRALPALFAEGSYEPLEAPENIVAFLRRRGDDAALVVVPRLSSFGWKRVCLKLPANLTLFDTLGNTGALDGREIALPERRVALFSTFSPA